MAGMHLSPILTRPCPRTKSDVRSAGQGVTGAGVTVTVAVCVCVIELELSGLPETPVAVSVTGALVT